MSRLSVNMQAKKKAEAEEHVRKADKALKTSFTKWTPDHDSAGDDYSKAATCYKVAKFHAEALDCLEKACECYKQCRSLFHAAKVLETSVLVCRDSEKFDLIPELASRGALLYRQHGSPESAAQLLEKAAKILEPRDPATALKLYEKAAETVMTEDRPKQAGEYMSKVSRLQVKGEMWEKAARSLEESIKLMIEAGSEMTLGRTVVSLVLVHLVREDGVEAAKVFQVWGGYCDPDQTTACHQMIDGFNDEDPDRAKQGLSAHCHGALDVEFQRIIKIIKIPDAEGGIEAAAKSYAASKAPVAKKPSSSGGAAELSHGVDPVPAAEAGATPMQREEDERAGIAAEERDRELAAGDEEDDDDEGLC